MQPTTLRCHCGQVQLHLSEAASAQFYCHCDDCRAVTGGAYTAHAAFAASGVRLGGGQTTTWTYKTLPRTRCAACGTLLFGEPPGMGMRVVGGFLLPTPLRRPTFHIRCQHALMPVKDDLPHFKDLPADFGGDDEKVGW